MDTFHKCTWDNELGRKKKYYTAVFNFTHNHQQKVFILLGLWEEILYFFCYSGRVEIEKHFILNTRPSKTTLKVMRIFW